MTLCYSHSESFSVVAEKVVKVRFINILYETSMIEVLFFRLLFNAFCACDNLFFKDFYFMFFKFFPLIRKTRAKQMWKSAEAY